MGDLYRSPWEAALDRIGEHASVPQISVPLGVPTKDWFRVLEELNGWGPDGWKTRFSNGDWPK